MTSIETSFPCWGSLFIIFVRVGRVIYALTMVQCAAFGCNNKNGNPGVEGSGRAHSFHYFPIKRLPLLTRLELFSKPVQLSMLYRVHHHSPSVLQMSS